MCPDRNQSFRVARSWPPEPKYLTFVQHGHAKVTQNTIRFGKQLVEGIPRMNEGIVLQEVVLAAVPGNFQLRPKAVRASFSFCDSYGFSYTRNVSLEVQRPLVEVACGHLHNRHARSINRLNDAAALLRTGCTCYVLLEIDSASEDTQDAAVLCRKSLRRQLHRTFVNSTS